MSESTSDRDLPTPARAQRPSWTDEVEEAYRVYGDGLRRFIRSRARTHGLPESALNVDEVLQETFARALEKWPTVEAPDKYLYTVARHLVSKIGKEARRYTSADLEALDGYEATGNWSSLPPQASVENQVLARLIIRDVRALPGKQAAATEMRHAGSYSSEEIGSHIDCSPGAARVHAHRGTNTVRARWNAFQGRMPSGRLGRAEVLTALVLGLLLWAAATAVLSWLGVPVLLAVVCPAALAAASGVIVWAAARRMRRLLHRKPNGDVAEHS
ncbi:RNA polymerase sigma factor [Streptomyces sp. NPDC058525]|uniref:RNA polymerase sigma factor n=1 Tax=Streptomyces sp. NPDC058525 TaxID=3346538 RepID=UPI003646AD2C